MHSRSPDIPWNTKHEIKHFSETGSPFDITNPRSKRWARVGAHEKTKVQTDEAAFSQYGRPSTTVNPKNYVKSGDLYKNLYPSPKKPDTSHSKRTIVSKNARKKRANPPNTKFRFYYERGDLPVQIFHTGRNKIQWKIDIAKLDFHHYLPIFFSGLREEEHPYSVLSYVGTQEMLKHGGDKVLPVIPQLIIPLTHALNTRNPDIILKVLHILQLLVEADTGHGDSRHQGLIGRALVPYYRQILPVLNIFCQEAKTKVSDKMEYGQRRGADLEAAIFTTLKLLEFHGGADAFINIKYLVPTFQTSVSMA